MEDIYPPAKCPPFFSRNFFLHPPAAVVSRGRVTEKIAGTYNWYPLERSLRPLDFCCMEHLFEPYTIQPWHSSNYYSNNNTIGHNTSWLRPSPTTILCFYADGHVKNKRFNASLLILCWPVAIIDNNKIINDVDEELPPIIINCHRYRCHHHNH